MMEPSINDQTSPTDKKENKTKAKRKEVEIVTEKEE